MTRSPRRAARAAAAETLLNCFMREGGEWFTARSDPRVAVLPLPMRMGELLVTLAYRSPTARHRFELPVQRNDGRLTAIGLEELATWLVTILEMDAPEKVGVDDIGVRMRSSVEAVEAFLAARDADVDRLWGPGPLTFVESEQALLLGHMLHPTPKSRGEMTVAERDAYAPELGARFALRWLAVDPALVEHDSATGTPAPGLVRDLLGSAAPGADGRTLVPAHPFQVQAARRRPEVEALFAAGSIEDLGPLGAAVTPTTSVRTVYHEDWPWQLKFSLNVRVTNSLRVTLPKELRRAVEAARLLGTEVGAAAREVAPRFTMLQDPAYLAVRVPGGGLVDELSVLLRENRWPGAATTDVSALTVLCQDHPYGDTSRLGALVVDIADREDREEHDVAQEWFARYCQVITVPLVRLYGELGLCMEPHQQNTLVELHDGFPVHGVYRDSQGYFHREAAHDDLVAVIPGLGEASESILPEALADERLVYDSFLNNALGVVNALGVAGVADERVLLEDLRLLLEAERVRPARYPLTLLDRLLDDERWPCKANLRTRVASMDELVGDTATQSVYVTIPNPLRG